MSKKLDIYTETMANVYARQGHWDKVAEIYRHLLTAKPERLDYADALAEAEAKIKEIERKTPEKLVPLFREWIDLLFKSEEMQKLKKLKERI